METTYMALNAGDQVVLVGTEQEWKAHSDPLSPSARATLKPGMLGIAKQSHPETADADSIVFDVELANGKKANVRRQFLARVPAAGTVFRTLPGCDGAYFQGRGDLSGLPKNQVPDGSEVTFVKVMSETRLYPGQFEVESPTAGTVVIGSRWLEFVREPQPQPATSGKPQVLILGDEDALNELLPKLDGRGLSWANGCMPSQNRLDSSKGLLIGYGAVGRLANVLEFRGNKAIGAPNGVLVANAYELDDVDLDRLFGPAKKPIRVTKAWLKSKQACRPGIGWFVETFGDGASVAPEAVKAALDDQNWLNWLNAALK